MAPGTLTTVFHDLLGKWKEDTRFCSSMREIIGNEHYRAIIALGPDVVPVILEHLEQEPEHLSSALLELTGENPLRPEHAGNIRALSETWVRWGRARGLV